MSAIPRLPLSRLDPATARARARTAGPPSGLKEPAVVVKPTARGASSSAAAAATSAAPKQAASSVLGAKRTAASAAIGTAGAAAKKLVVPAKSIKEQLDEAEKAMQEMRARLSAGEDAASLLQQQHDQATARVAALSEQLVAAQAEAAQLNARCATTARELHCAQDMVECLKRELDSAHEEHAIVVKDLRLASEENAQLKETISFQSMEIDNLTSALHTLRSQLEASDQLNEQRAARIRELEARVAALEQQHREDEALRRQLHNTIQELKGNIRVYCRVRPAMADETVAASGDTPTVEVLPPEAGEVRKIQINAAPEPSVTGVGPDKQRTWNFTFDKVFGERSTQADVFAEISQLVQSAMDGYNVCIFAYGQTGSGKTFTMEGGDLAADPESRGMIPRAVEQVFAAMKQEAYAEWEFALKASFLEIYNEQIRDLLAPVSGSGAAAAAAGAAPKYEIKHERSGAVYVTDLLQVPVTEAAEVFSLLRQAAQQRAVGRTQMNERSSRSHSLFQLSIEAKNKVTGASTAGLLNLIDLAGSERLTKSGSSGTALKETQAINKSLACLGDVITALANREAHIPYRNSKLTHILQNSLGGDAKTLMFVNVSPTTDSMQETLCSLRFAAKVNSCDIGTARRQAKVDKP